MVTGIRNSQIPKDQVRIGGGARARCSGITEPKFVCYFSVISSVSQQALFCQAE